MACVFFLILSRNEQYCSEYVDDAHQTITINNSFVCLLLYQDLKDKTFLQVINKYVEVHATVGGGVSVSVSSTLKAFTMIRIYFLPLIMIVENFNSSDA